METPSTDFAEAEIVILSTLKDNYTYLIHCTESEMTAVVDPGVGEPVLKALDERNWTLGGILNTHPHTDHIAGNEELLKVYPGIPVCGHSRSLQRKAIPGQSVGLENRQELTLGKLKILALHTPGHTLEDITYVCGEMAFTGDTLFGAGCGKLFDGTPAMMYRSLNEVIAKLPLETMLFFGHELTEANLRFASHIEPGNPHIRDRVKSVYLRNLEGLPTTPTTLALEKQTNPFLRVDEPELLSKGRGNGGKASPIQALAEIRAAKDRF